MLERIDFDFAVATIVSGGLIFLGKLWSGHRSDAHGPRVRDKKRGEPKK